MLGGAALSLGGIIGGAFAGGKLLNPAQFVSGSMIGGQIAGQLGGFINSLAPTEQISKATSSGKTTTVENKEVTDILRMLDDCIKKEPSDIYLDWV